MIHTEKDFYNKVAKEIRITFFPQEVHGKTTNPLYFKTSKAMEDFSNGVISYKIFIGRLARYCNTTILSAHSIVSKYIIDFGNENLLFLKIENKNKDCILINGEFSWVLKVDSKEINFKGLDNAEYFEKHYRDLGYNVRIQTVFKT